MNRIGLLGDNSVDFVRTLINIWNNGDCAVIIDWRIPFKMICNMLVDSSVNECYIDDNLITKKIDNDTRGIKFISYKTKNSTTELLPEEIYDLFNNNYSHEEAIILFSSGTTGKAKGIALSHYAINTNADMIQNYMQLKMVDYLYIIKTLSHSSTIVGELLVALKAKAKLLISPTIISPRLILENVKNYEVNIMCMNPSLLHLLTITPNIKKYVDNLKIIYTSGAILRQNIFENALMAFPYTKILNVYGLTEAGPRVSAQRINDIHNSIGSVGKVIDNVIVKIILENGDEAINKEIGIIHVKTPCRYIKYTTGENSKISLYKDWLNTGDLGYIDEYNDLYIVGRQDNMITIGSHNVYPEEIEKIILEIDGIYDCVIIPEENHLYGFRMICFYVSEHEIEADLINKCKEHLANYECPYKFVKVNTLPTTNNGKHSRKINDYKLIDEAHK